ncbi:hypothetical protein BaRGS_00017974, partial [Batillaria attramentaria]
QSSWTGLQFSIRLCRQRCLYELTLRVWCQYRGFHLASACDVTGGLDPTCLKTASSRNSVNPVTALLGF